MKPLEKIILTVYGPAKLLPQRLGAHYWQRDYELPDKRVVPHLIATKMREDYVRAIAKEFRKQYELETGNDYR